MQETIFQIAWLAVVVAIVANLAWHEMKGRGK